MPKYRVEVCFTTWSYYSLEIEADNEDAIDEDAVIELASEIDVPDKVDSGGAEVTLVEEIEDDAAAVS